MTDTPNLALPYIAAAQAQKHVTHNEAMRLLDGMVQIGVISRVVGTPPGSPAEGDRYLVPTGATGAWAGWDGSIAFRADAAWLRLIPKAGWLIYSAADGLFYVYGGASWAVLAGAAGAATRTGVETLTNKTLDNTNTITLKDTLFTLQDDGDATKQLQVQLSGLTTGTTRTLTVPDASGTLALLSAAQTWTAANVFQSSSGSYSTGGATGTVNLATGATISGSAKTVNIGTAGVSGSTTTISIGPTAGAGTVTINAGAALVVLPDMFRKAPAAAVISGAATLTNANIQTGRISYTGGAAAVTMPLGSTLDSIFPAANDVAIELSVINTGAGAATMTANTGVTILGGAVVANGTSAAFLIRKTATSTYVLERMA